MIRKIIIVFAVVITAFAITCMPVMAEAAEPTTEAVMMAKLLYRECRGVPDKAEQAAVAWCVLNRVDHEDYPDTIAEVITQRHQFAWVERTPVREELLELAEDVIARWEREKISTSWVGRVLPEEYIFFAGRTDGRNYFRDAYRNANYWDWEYPSPYEEET